MQYKVGKKISRLIIAANNIDESSILRLSSIKPTRVIMPKDANISSINSAPDALIILLPLITNSNLSLLKVISEFLFTSQITPIIVSHDKIIISVAKATAIPMNIPRKNIKFQKLSLFNLTWIKLRITAPNFNDIIHSYDIKHLFKKLCFFRDSVEVVNKLVQFLKNPLRIVNIINNVIGNSRLYHKMK